MPAEEPMPPQSAGRDKGLPDTSVPAESSRSTTTTGLPQRPVVKASAPTAMLSPRAVPVWAAKETEQQEQQSDGGTVTSNDNTRPSNLSVTSSSGRTHVTSGNQLQNPPSPILAATNTTEPLFYSTEAGSSQSRWKDFVLQSQPPDQGRIENELRSVSTALIGSGTTAGALLRGPTGDKSKYPDGTPPNERKNSNVSKSSRSGHFIHQKRKIIPISDLEQQMDLSGPWNPGREHKPTGAVSELVSRAGAALSIPTAAPTADHHHSSRLSQSGSFSDYSTNSLVQFQMTSEIAEKQRRKRWKINLRVMLLDNPYVPMTLRSGIFVLSVLALALAVSVFRYSSQYNGPGPISQQPSTIMAICVQSVAMVYLVYITYDEYSGKPLGLRNAKDKVKLIMLDLLFIIFSSANLSLSFNTLYDKQWLCQSPSVPSATDATPYDGPICSRQRGLASFLFLVLLMWVMTFTISIFRVVERVSGGGNEV
ncbi:uncharacterized protein V1513DRAFT_399300 [Lipomyces chichibuensis]|uniref:uncharacterized protein n=1 Tax=Lipomyces chichibuensis TaxID=1546026 RepID=UPI0033432C07